MYETIKHIRVVAFDWDGTLVDSFPEIGRAFQLAAKKLNLPDMHPDVVRQHIGGGHDIMFRAIYDELSIEESIPCRELFWSTFYEVYQSSHVKLFPGVLSSLQQLKKQGFALYIATNKPSHSFFVEYEAMPELHGLFDQVLCADQYRGKPDPLMLSTIVESAGVQASELLMVGDTSFDVLAAKANGSPVAAVSCGNMTADELADLEPDWLDAGVPEVCARVVGAPILV